ncbi:MAG: type II toxin-antitoxin system prevent-host-death family antitoxin [Dethiobacter sp.]|nr:type II toxin-antitoxin system prevent-host-death family antitoxin [Dethiobacter sp.]
MHKPSCGLREAKANFSRLVNEVRKGAEIILTERGKPVARLAPIIDEALSLEARLAKLEYAGWIEPLNRYPRKMPAPLPFPGEKAQTLLQEDRSR